MSTDPQSVVFDVPPRRARGGRIIAALVALAFLAGFGLMGYAMWKWQPFAANGDVRLDNEAGLAMGAADPTIAPPRDDPSQSRQPAMAAVTPATLDVQAARILELEQRLARISLSAEAAAGNAGRAEGMMMAFAARRALDSGQPLGYVEPQLRLRFGTAQPKAVATIVNAAAEPVTLPDLRAGLEDITVASEAAVAQRSWWDSVWTNLRTLAVVRDADEPSSAPRERIASARCHVEAGMIDAAITDILALQPNDAVSAWLEKARRYNEARRALDLIEAAAMLESRVAVEQPTTTPTPAATAAK